MIADRNRVAMFFTNLKGRLPGGPIRRYYRLKTAYSIAREVSSVPGIEDCLKALVNRISSYMAVKIVSVMFIDKDKRRLIVKVAKGLDEEVIKEANTQIGEGVAGWVGRTGEPLLVKDITKDPRFVKRSESRYYNNSLLSVPLKTRDKVSGIINVNNKISRDIFRTYDLELLKTIADIAAPVIENARLEEEIKKVDRSKYDLVSNVSHELRTPLATINEALSVILDGLAGPVNEKQKRYLEMSKKSVARLSRLTEEFLESAKRERARLDIKRNLFNITDVAKNVVESLSVLAKEKRIVLEGIIPDKKVEIWGDPDKLNQVIINLVDNAIKYNKPYGKVAVSMDENESSVTISVSDTGMGIPKEELDKIFNRFYRVEKNIKDEIPGTGLGLSIVKDIINMHKGEISVESE
ncbi:MAG: GAF domain-containing sensor histidine kinase, partial [Candidatus Omnitrophica bacterium]|nr:GAF domain-containing sensor histidine kinase [Candidatus Omnitrophota bacterium]